MHHNADHQAAGRRQACGILDEAMIAELRELDEGEDGLLIELVDMFREESARRVDELRKALEIADLAAAERIAHAMKSAASNIGAKQLSANWQQLELDTRKGNTLEQLQACFQRCLDAYEESTAALDELLGRSR